MSDDEQKDQYIYDNHVDYDNLITGSMHWLIRTVLGEVARKGFPGEHHLYISFDTTDPTVSISESLHKRYPEEMTIVLQNRYYDLVVTERDFSVSLSFSRVLERLTVPYSALTRFYDPFCGFVLQLSNWEEGMHGIEMPEHAFEQDQMSMHYGSAAPRDSEEAKEWVSDPAGDDDESKIVSLDQFRKK
ncbi:MAG: hypothetical protein HRT36_08880 [Alphaproteobacteria bacterium]|nr:hypothetical protein [Alphaproteobacteria bacterium]